MNSHAFLIPNRRDLLTLLMGGDAAWLPLGYQFAKNIWLEA